MSLSLWRAAVICIFGMLIVGHLSGVVQDGSHIRLSSLCYPSAAHAGLRFEGFPWDLPNPTPMKMARSIYHICRVMLMCPARMVPSIDARTRTDRSALSYEKRGFTFRHLQSRANFTLVDGTIPEPELIMYVDELVSIVKEMHPDVKSVHFLNLLLRGRGKNPPFSGVHTDYDCGVHYPANLTNNPEVDRLGEAAQKNVILGIWKPVNMKDVVCKRPLAVLDASTFAESDLVHVYADYQAVFDGALIDVSKLSGTIIHDDRHKWYYVSNMTTEEILIFTHFTSDSCWVNPHSAFTRHDCPETTEERQSIEVRLLLLF